MEARANWTSWKNDRNCFRIVEFLVNDCFCYLQSKTNKTTNKKLKETKRRTSLLKFRLSETILNDLTPP